MTAAVGARNFFKVDAGVVHALLQARYYEPTIELDLEYRYCLKQYNSGSPIEIKSEVPRRSVSEIESYETSRYGPP
jgi:hypothetical protein